MLPLEALGSTIARSSYQHTDRARAASPSYHRPSRGLDSRSAEDRGIIAPRDAYFPYFSRTSGISKSWSSASQVDPRRQAGDCPKPKSPQHRMARLSASRSHGAYLPASVLPCPASAFSHAASFSAAMGWLRRWQGEHGGYARVRQAGFRVTLCDLCATKPVAPDRLLSTEASLHAIVETCLAPASFYRGAV